jgi:hypothetical protein
MRYEYGELDLSFSAGQIMSRKAARRSPPKQGSCGGLRGCPEPPLLAPGRLTYLLPRCLSLDMATEQTQVGQETEGVRMWPALMRTHDHHSGMAGGASWQFARRMPQGLQGDMLATGDSVPLAAVSAADGGRPGKGKHSNGELSKGLQRR